VSSMPSLQTYSVSPYFGRFLSKNLDGGANFVCSRIRYEFCKRQRPNAQKITSTAYEDHQAGTTIAGLLEKTISAHVETAASGCPAKAKPSCPAQLTRLALMIPINFLRWTLAPTSFIVKSLRKPALQPVPRS
jgi:hypothetical protein